MTTETPRTDAEIWDVVYHHKNEIVVDVDFARELERELSEARALCAAQHKAIERLEQESKPEYWIEKGLSYCERAEKAEAEVELLKQGKVFVDPKWVYDLETQLAKAHEELCQAGLREYGV